MQRQVLRMPPTRTKGLPRFWLPVVCLLVAQLWCTIGPYGRAPELEVLTWQLLVPLI